MSDRAQFKVNIEPKRIMITSEPYVMYSVRGYQAVVDILDSHTKREYFLFVSARTLATPLELLRESNNGYLTGLEF